MIRGVMKRLLLAVLLALPLSATPPLPPLTLDVDTIMRGYGLTGYAPRNVRWSPDGQQVFFEWKRWSDPTEENFDTYVAGRDGKGLRKLTDDEAREQVEAFIRGEPVERTMWSGSARVKKVV